MPWKTGTLMEKRNELVSLARNEEFMVTELSKRFEVSRKTAHKWISRYEEGGPECLVDRSRAPKHSPQRTSKELERLMLRLKRGHPTWGAKKIRVLLERDHGVESPPAVGTIGEIMKRHGLVKKRRRRPGVYPALNEELTEAARPNHVWGVDHKGWFWLDNDSRCIPLTVSDLHSRYIIAIEADTDSTQASARRGFEKAFRRYGLPEIIRVDNGSPFASMGAGRLSKLSVWWIGQGVKVEFTRPGNPQDNGCHERMHRTLKGECCSPGSVNRVAQQQRFDRWREKFKDVRPYESLGQKVPADLYHPSNLRLDRNITTRLYDPLEETLRVNQSGFISLDGKAFHVGEALAGTEVALDRNEKGLIEVRYSNVKLGEYRSDQSERRLMYPGCYAEEARMAQN
ncbi:MAG: DDE-type integrase/transposase/recombinase [Verrucomicrobiales bacterium]|nr:DDE-type integrase/transposase/recombinase [Verrucomicrobiales bacterium]